VFPTLFKVKGNGRVVSESRESAFRSIVNFLVSAAGLTKLVELIEGECVRRIHNVKV
jgi:hypothetical protein